MKKTTTPCQLYPSVFHAPDDAERADSDRRRERIEAARELCLECPIMIACRDRGRELGETGIWGGEDDDERAAAGYPPKATKRPPADCGTEAGARRHRRAEHRKPCAPCLIAERAAKRDREARAAARATAQTTVGLAA